MLVKHLPIKPMLIKLVQVVEKNFNNGIKVVLIKLVDSSNNNKHSKYFSIIKNRLKKDFFISRFANQIPAHQVYNELLGPDAFKDVILDIDYGAMGGFNVAFQSGSDLAGGQLPPGINIRPAYTTVDSLNYQQHMFNTARTINAGGESNSYNIGGTSNAYDVSGGQHFDAAKAIFNQADINHDGSISRDEFRQWAQAGQQGYGGQSHTATAGYQTNFRGHNDGFYQASLFAGADPAVANILQQSGLGQVVPNQ